jgi:hypothetical protein
MHPHSVLVEHSHLYFDMSCEFVDAICTNSRIEKGRIEFDPACAGESLPGTINEFFTLPSDLHRAPWSTP